MTPVERLQAAIEKLEVMQAFGPVTGHEHPDYAVLEFESGDSLALSVRPDYVLTLARTIDAQLAILQFGVKRQNAVDWLSRAAGHDLQKDAAALELALADAILGVDS